MRAVFVGAGSLTVNTARVLLKRGHELVLVERDRERIDALEDELDCGFIHGDGSRPVILREADPGHSDMLFCLTGDDQTNIIASLVGRSLGYERVVTKIENPEFEHVCIELGLHDTVIPSRTAGIHLADLFEGHDPLEFSTMIREDARVIDFVVDDETAGALSVLELPRQARVVCIYRKDELLVPDDDTNLEAGDEVVVITHRDHLESLTERFGRDH